MIDHIGRVNMNYMVRLANDPEWTAGQREALMHHNMEHGAVYDGKPIPVSMKPHFISPRQRKTIETAVMRIMSALDAFIQQWLHDEELQKMWGVTDAEMELYRIDPGYPQPIQIARLDALLNEYDLQFLEFNCDSPGGTGYADVIHQGFLKMFEDDGLGEQWNISTRQRMAHLAQTIRMVYATWWANGHTDHAQQPLIVVADWRDVSSMPDIDIAIRYLRDEGMDAVYADPRDMTFDGERLMLGDRQVDMVYKRVIVKELINEPDAAPLAEAYKAGAVCMVNSPRSVIVGNKKILAALRLPKIQKILSVQERAILKAHLPWTEILRDHKVEFKGFTVNLKDFTIDNKDQLVLKAAQSYGGKDVFLGFETDQKEWEALVEREIDTNAWIVQQLVDIPKELFPEFENGQVNMKLLNVNINPLAFSGKYAGCYTRISPKNVINVSYGGGMIPTMTLEPKFEDPQ